MDQTFVERPDFENDPSYAVGEEVPAPVNAESLPFDIAEIDSFDDRVGDDIEGLLYLGHIEQDFNYLGHSFVVRTLRAGERLAALALVKDYEDTLGLDLALQTVMVAASLELVDGRVLSAPLSPVDDKPLLRIKRNMEIIERWYEPVIAAIYDQCSALLLRQRSAIAELEGKS